MDGALYDAYVVQLDFSAAFDRARHSGILLNLKSIVVGGCVLCRVPLNRRQRVEVDGAPNEWIPIVFWSVGSSSVHPIHQRNVWAGGVQTICLCR